MHCESARAWNSPTVEAVRSIELERYASDRTLTSTDQVAVEEPLEIRIDGYPISVIMRTPGHDRELAAGFLLTERIIRSLADVRKIEERPEENRVLVFLADEVEIDLQRLSRHFFAGSSCGICGKATLDSIFLDCPRISQPLEVSASALLAAPERLRGSQTAFDATGGLHAAGIFTAAGELLVSNEDVGRHNAVDKVIGRAAFDHQALDATFLLVSGRASFEILQKALAARIPVVAAISAPSSLAVDFARQSGQTLIGFLRPPHFNRYTG